MDKDKFYHKGVPAHVFCTEEAFRSVASEQDFYQLYISACDKPEEWSNDQSLSQKDIIEKEKFLSFFKDINFENIRDFSCVFHPRAEINLYGWHNDKPWFYTYNKNYAGVEFFEINFGDNAHYNSQRVDISSRYGLEKTITTRYDYDGQPFLVASHNGKIIFESNKLNPDDLPMVFNNLYRQNFQELIDKGIIPLTDETRSFFGISQEYDDKKSETHTDEIIEEKNEYTGRSTFVEGNNISSHQELYQKYLSYINDVKNQFPNKEIVVCEEDKFLNLLNGVEVSDISRVDFSVSHIDGSSNIQLTTIENKSLSYSFYPLSDTFSMSDSKTSLQHVLSNGEHYVILTDRDTGKRESISLENVNPNDFALVCNKYFMEMINRDRVATSEVSRRQEIEKLENLKSDLISSKEIASVETYTDSGRGR